MAMDCFQTRGVSGVPRFHPRRLEEGFPHQEKKRSEKEWIEDGGRKGLVFGSGQVHVSSAIPLPFPFCVVVVGFEVGGVGGGYLELWLG